MNAIRNALTRKFGPLPAWAWAAIGAAAIFAYRAARGQYSGGGGGASAQDSTDTAEPAERPEPVTISPGESVYDPATGQLIGTAPEQQPVEDEPDKTPIVLRPGQGLWDPTTGKLITLPVHKPAKKRRKPKPKPHHKPGKHHKPPHNAKPKPHGSGKVTHPIKRAKQKASAVVRRPRARQTFHPDRVQGPSRGRIRAVPTGNATVKQHTQATHPAPHRASTAHPKATPKPKRKTRSR